MPRPQKDGLDYFPLDVTFFSDSKIKILKARYGVDGISIYIYLLCEIYRAGYYLQLNADSFYIIADDLKMSAEKVMQVLNFLLERSLFDRILFQSDKVLTSAGIQKRFQLAVKERAKKNPIEIRDFWLLEEAETESFIKVNPSFNNSGKNQSNSGKNPDNSREKSLKESKVKKRKEKNLQRGPYSADAELNQAILRFVGMREEMEKPMTEEAVKLLIEKLEKLSQEPAVQVDILNQSVMLGWADVYPLKKERSGAQGKKQESSKAPRNRFHNYEQDSYDYDEMVWSMMREQGGVSRQPEGAGK